MIYDTETTVTRYLVSTFCLDTDGEGGIKLPKDTPKRLEKSGSSSSKTQSGIEASKARILRLAKTLILFNVPENVNKSELEKRFDFLFS